MDLTDFFNSINKTKKNIITDDKSERFYVPYIINKSMSYHKDSIFHSNMMNMNPMLDKKIQYDYYLYSLPKASRYAKWQKPEESDIGAIMTLYGFSRQKAMEVRQLLSKSQMQDIAQATNTGGKS